MNDHVSFIRLGPDGKPYSITLKDGLTPAQHAPGLYRVTVDVPHRHLEVSRATGITTENAAVNGIQNHLDRAALVMFDKVNATADLRRAPQPTEFTLYHVPSLSLGTDLVRCNEELAGIGTPESKQLAKVITEAWTAQRAVVWSVHSRGAAVFDAAVRSCAEHGGKVERQAVAVYNGATNNDTMARDLRRAGVAAVGKGFYNAAYDPVPQLVGANTLNPIARARALYNARAVIFDEASLHTWHTPLQPDDYNSVPPAQWHDPGKDLRPPPKIGDRLLSPESLAQAGVKSDDPSYRLLQDAITGRRIVAQAAASDRAAAVELSRQAFDRDVAGPDVTAVPLRARALAYVRGDASAEALLSAAEAHSTAIARQNALGLASPHGLALGRGH